MNSPAVTNSAVDEINRLHAEATHLAAASRRSRDTALIAARRAGALLIEEKKRVAEEAAIDCGGGRKGLAGEGIALMEGGAG